MVKNKIRKIIVDNEEYAWNIKGRFLKIWKDKKVIHTENFLSDIIVTPKYVAELICLVNTCGDISNK